MKHFLYKPIRRAIDEREKRIATEVADADKKKNDALKESEEFKRKNEEFDRQRPRYSLKRRTRRKPSVRSSSMKRRRRPMP